MSEAAAELHRRLRAAFEVEEEPEPFQLDRIVCTPPRYGDFPFLTVLRGGKE